MRLVRKSLGFVCLPIFLASIAYGATITGTVKGPDGASFKGAFVEARNMDSKMTYNVLSYKDGHYRIENLPAGQYEVKIRAVGFKAEPRNGVTLTADQNTSMDWSLQKGMVHWTDLSIYEGIQSLPNGEGKDKLTTTCFACHGFQTRMASAVRDESGWRDRVNFMRSAFGFFLRSFNDKDEAQVVSYMTKEFGPDSDLPKSPTDLPAYQEVKQGEFSDAAMRIVYVSYELPGPNRFPGAAKPEKDGKVYLWTYNQHRFGILDPKTAIVTEYPIPGTEYAANHSTVRAPDGMVWFTEANGDNVIGKLDPATGKVTTYHDNIPGNKHTMVIDSKGIIYTSGGPVSKFDPKTEQWTNYAEIPTAYGMAIDKNDTLWFSEFKKDGQIGKIDPQTGKVTRYAPPTAGACPRRMHFDTDGLLWIAEYCSGKIASFDVKTERFKEYQLPGASPSPYALNIDKNHHIWYSSMDMDVMGELDPSTGKIIEYPFIYSENGIRDFFPDAEGNMWWGSQPNDHVGYFHLTGPMENSDRPKGNNTKPAGRQAVVQE